MRAKLEKKEPILLDSTSLSKIVIDDSYLTVFLDIVVNPFFYLFSGINSINVYLSTERLELAQDKIKRAKNIQQFLIAESEIGEQFLNFKEKIIASKSIDLTSTVSSESLKSRKFKHRFLSIPGLYPNLKVDTLQIENTVQGDGELTTSEISNLLNSGISPDSVISDFPIQLPTSFFPFKRHRQISKKIEQNLAKKQRISKKLFRHLNKKAEYDICEIETPYTSVTLEIQIKLSDVIGKEQIFAYVGSSIGSSKRVRISQNFGDLITKNFNIPIDSDEELRKEQTGNIDSTTRLDGPGFFIPSGKEPKQSSFFSLQNKGQTFSTPVSKTQISQGFHSKISSEIAVKPTQVQKQIVRTKASPSFISKVSGVSSSRQGLDSKSIVIPFSVSPANNGFASITIADIPGEIVSVQVQRKEPAKGMDYQTINSPYTREEAQSQEIIDKSVVHSRAYQYRLSCFDKRGSIVFTSNTFEYFHTSNQITSTADNGLLFSLLSTNVSSEGSNPLIEFQFNIELTEEGIISLRRFLSSAGIDESVIQSTLNDPKNYGNVISYSVSRQNLKTSEMENLGTHSSPTFFDRPSLLEDYKYIFRPSIRPPGSITNEQITERRNPKTGKNYSFNSYKFFSRRDSLNLPSEEEMSDKPSEKIFSSTEFLSSKEISVDIRSNTSRLSIFAAQVSKTSLGANSIKWKSSSLPGEIDHFQIYAILDGVESYIGSAHALDDNHEYEDYHLFDRTGEITYKIVPVLSDFTVSNIFQTVVIVKRTSLPEIMEKVLANQ